MRRWLKKPHFALSVFVFALAISARAQTSVVTENFMNAADISSTGGMVWNLALGMLHPPLLIANWNSGSGATSTSFSVGDGHHGPFNLSTYALFVGGTLSGTTITIDTNQYPELDVTTFDLLAGYTLRPTGPNPLVIRSQSDVIIDGTIDCSGAPGTDATSDPTAVFSGAVGICGGANGGASVATLAAPGVANSGSAGGPQVTGGAGGALGSGLGGVGGGGGGAYTYAGPPAPTAGSNPGGGGGGAAGTIFDDDAFSTDSSGAGSGGGGGSAAPGNSSGASGGAGGGSIQIYAVHDVTVTLNGTVLANGGNGGNANGSFNGGGGGGGGAGSILIFAGDVITLNGPVTGIGGGGGISGGGQGGNGAYGRTWIVDSTGGDTGSSPEDPTSNLTSKGAAEYETGVTYQISSNAIDLGNSAPTVTSLPVAVTNPLSASVNSYLLAFSYQTDLSLFPSYALASTFINAAVSRFVTFQLRIQNNNATTPVEITGLTYNLNDFTQTHFEFNTGCGGTGSQTAPGLIRSASLGLFLLPFIFASAIRVSRRSRRRRKR